MRHIAFALLLTVGLLSVIQPCLAADQKLLLVVIDNVTWHDLLDPEVRAPTIHRLAEEGAPGMMCVRSGRGVGGEYATIGAGSRASSRLDLMTHTGIEAGAFQAGERVGETTARTLFTARSGWSPGSSAIVHLGIGELFNENEDASYPIQLGLLGGTLDRAGIRVACAGNADTLDTPHREAVAIAMDEHGLVPMGEVSGVMTRRSPGLSGGLTSNAQMIAVIVERLSRATDFIILDTGETSRVETSAAWMTPSALGTARRRAIERTDQLLAEVLHSLPRSQWSVLIVTPSMRDPTHMESFAALAPVIWWTKATGEEARRRRSEEAHPAPRLLTSASTHRPGIVVNTDIAPSVLTYFGIPIPQEMVGRPFAVAAGTGINRLQADLTRHDAIEATRPQLVRGLAVIAAITLWLAALLMLVGNSAPAGLRALVRGILTVLMSAPVAMLLVALRPLPPSTAIVSVVGLSVAIAFLSSWVTSWRAGYVVPSLLVIGMLVYDLFASQQLLYWSPLSYSPAAGARFYGIGNEYGGVLLGAAIITGGSLLRGQASRLQRVLVGLLLLALAALTGLPNYGANLGMSLALGVGGAVFCLYLWRRSVRWPEVIGAVVVVVCLIFAAMWLDYLRHGSEASHIGRWVAAVRQDGWQAASSVFERKLSMNWMLVRVSLWTDAALAALAVLVVAVVARPGRLVAVLRERPWLTPAIVSSVVGAAAAFALNDSGIVAAALALVYTSGALGYAALGER